MPNYIDKLEKLGLSKQEIADKTGKTLKTIYTHQSNPETLKKLECLGYEKLIEMVKSEENIAILEKKMAKKA